MTLAFAALRRLAFAAVAAPLAFASAAQAQGPALWKVSDDDSHIYLFGTMHVLPGGDDWLAGPVAAALEESEALVLEIDLDEAGQLRSMALVGRLGMYGGDERLSQKMSEEEFAALTARIGVPGAMVDRMRPWLAATTLVAQRMAQEGLDPEAGAERTLKAAAAKRGVDDEGLETLERQLSMLADAPEAEQIAMLQATLIGLDELAPMFDAMHEAWAAGDIDALAALVEEEMKLQAPEFHQKLLVDRNRAWTPLLAARLERDETAFVGVGAGHLVGADSVLTMLEAKGFRVERLQ